MVMRYRGPRSRMGRDQHADRCTSSANCLIANVCSPHLERGVTPVGAPRLAAHRLLSQEPRRGDHCQPAVRELLLLHEPELGRVLRLEVERVEAQVAGVVALTQRRGGLVGVGVDLRPALRDAELLGRGNASEHAAPQRDWELRDLVDGGPAIAGEERVELLLHEEPRGRKHRHTPVCELGLAESVDLELVLGFVAVRQEARGVELAEDVGTARKAVRELDLLRRGGLLAEGEGHRRRRTQLRGRHRRRSERSRGERVDVEHVACV
mmetsp:Transcript_42598/g.124806  ORF Transcript_42598/g.124806 Transcript_42598/m.124806 type:complete len:266 (-) Transcript_42598:15-812(-)